MEFKAGQQWTYRAPAGFENSRIVIGAVLTFNDHDRIVCCSVTAAPERHPSGDVRAVTISFLPMTEAAFASSVIAPDGEGALPQNFIHLLEDWRNDSRGLVTFTVPFEGFLDRMVALQMEAIAGRRAA